MAERNKLLEITLLALMLMSSVMGHVPHPHPHQRPRPHPEVHGVNYDARSLVINGKREILFSGSIHYTRSTPDMWPDILFKARHGGLNVIQTYVFWNVHEPVQGQYNFEGQYDLVKFIKLIGENGMFATLRVGPFIQAEWNHGGLPYWLREVPNIIFRSDNEPFKHHMEKWVTTVVNKLKEARLFASQGGPIILSQIENEYNTVQLAYKQNGNNYVQWAGNMAMGLHVGVPWVMCKQRDAPDPVINTCNGRYCGDTFPGPNKPNKPTLWTENWTAQFRVFGDPPSIRSAEDIAFAVARFFSKNGTLNNYYMYHGGTNFGRTAAHFVTTRYYDEAPLDEFGLQREPKWGHLKDLHKAINMCKRTIIWGNARVENLGPDLEARLYEGPGSCVAFLSNNNSKTAETVKFRGIDYLLPARSISILPDCKTVVFNTQQIIAQHNLRKFEKSIEANKRLVWEMAKENIPAFEQLTMRSRQPLELFQLTKDNTDYAWFTTILNVDPRDLPVKQGLPPVLRVASLGHALVAFVNGEYIGREHGDHVEKSFVFEKPINLKPGVNQITLVGSLVGLPDSGAYMEHRYAGPRSVELLGLNSGTRDLTNNNWAHQVGMEGEKIGIFTPEGANKAVWTKDINSRSAFTWYKTYFDQPEGTDPVAVRMNKMGKGMIWINGKSIGRYWVSYLSPLGQPTQSEYHIPRSYLQPKDNLMVILEEEPNVRPEEVDIVVVNRDTVCSFIKEDYTPSVHSWEVKDGVIAPTAENPRTSGYLTCPSFKVIEAVEFASFGDPSGTCGNFFAGSCTAPLSKEVVEKNCLGRNSCQLPVDNAVYGNACPNIPKKTLAVQVKCAYKK